MTGSAPFRCWSGLAMLSANPYEVSAAKIMPTPAAVLCPSRMEGSAIKMAPPMPTANPANTRPEGARRAMTAATTAVNKGLAPFSIPVSADETCCSAKGNMLSGKAIQRTPIAPMPIQSDRKTGLRDPGNKESVPKPIRMRRKVTALGPTTRMPSAMKRNEAPQTSPGSTSNSQPPASTFAEEDCADLITPRIPIPLSFQHRRESTVEQAGAESLLLLIRNYCSRLTALDLLLWAR